MSDNSKFIDYDPVTRPRKTGLGAKSSEECWPEIKSAESVADFDREGKPFPTFRHEERSLPRESEKASASGKPGTLKMLRTRGHSASFAGLFLFTLVLCFRPYELFSALSWMSTSAFWIAAVTLVVFVLTQLGLEANLTARPREVNLVLLLLVTGLLSIPGAYNPGEAWETFVEFLKVALIFIVLVNVVRSELRLKLLLWIAVAVSIVLSLGALNDYRTGNTLAEGRVRGVIGGMFGNPNDLALNLVTVIPIVVAFFLAGGLLKKLVYSACVIVMVAGCVVTFSRGGLLGLVATGVVMTWKLGRNHRVAGLVTFGCITVALIVLFPSGFASRIGLGDASAIQRQAILFRSLFIALRHPFFGIGMGNFHIVSVQEMVSHNAYTQVAAELGLLALAAYVIFMLSPLKMLRGIERETFSDRRKLRFHYYLAVGLQASLVGYMVSSFFASVAYQWYVYYLVGYAISLHRLYSVSKVAETSAVDKAGADRVLEGTALSQAPAHPQSSMMGHYD
jgi:putative inorganic carbon (hco3(-)) transporter